MTANSAGAPSGGSADLRDNYAGAFDGALALGQRPALVVIDMVRAYTEPGSPLYAGDSMPGVVATIAGLVDEARALGIPVIWTVVAYQAGGVDGGVFYKKVPALAVFADDGPLTNIAEPLKPAPDEIVITKQYASSFFGTSLAATLTAAGVDSLVLTGVSTSGCVRATAVDGCQHGFITVVARDGVGDRRPEPHEANLFDIQAKYGEVLDSDAVLEWWRSRSSG
jgi:nicotinamidase-related amidase